MVTKLNTKRYVRANRDSFINAVEAFQGHLKPITLVVDNNALQTLDSIFTFSKLKQETQVENVVKCDEEASSVLHALIDDTTVVFLVDVRSDLVLNKEMEKLLRELRLSSINIITTTNNGRDTELGLIRDYLREIIPLELVLVKWHILPMESLDDNVLDCNILMNSEGNNLYYPKNPYYRNATVNILVNNLSDSVVSILEKENITLIKSVALGENSKRLIDIIQQRLELSDTTEKKFIRDAKFGKLKSGERNDLIVFERSLDTLTPMMTDLTYSGILSETKRMDFTPNDDDIWDQLKFLNFGAVGSNLNTLAKDLQMKYESRHEANTISEIKNFVDNLGDLQSRQEVLKKHTVQSSELMDFLKEIDFKDTIDFEHNLYENSLDSSTVINKIVEMMCFETEESNILRLCCLFSQIKQGLREKDFTALRQELVDTFGNEMIFKLKALEDYKLLSKKHLENSKDYQSIIKVFDTMPDVDIEPLKPRDMNYAFSGAVPIMSRLLQSMFDRSVFVKNNNSILQSFIHSKEPTLTRLETLLADMKIPVDERNWINKDGKIIGDVKNEPDLTLLVFIGGITRGEISTIKFLQERLRSMDIPKEFVIVTDGIITGNEIFAKDISALMKAAVN